DAVQQKLHFLPCNINYDGKANINKYFLVKKLKDESSKQNNVSTDEREEKELYETFFRGRRLIGKLHEVNEEYEGYIFRESSSYAIKRGELPTSVEEMEEPTRNWDTIYKFNSFMVWEHDEIPDSSNNEIVKSLDWLNISKIIHKPTAPEA
ncbi:10752_t:CDS:2, partial [Acaulospora morrowiae]